VHLQIIDKKKKKAEACRARETCPSWLHVACRILKQERCHDEDAESWSSTKDNINGTVVVLLRGSMLLVIPVMFPIRQLNVKCCYRVGHEALLVLYQDLAHVSLWLLLTWQHSITFMYVTNRVGISLLHSLITHLEAIKWHPLFITYSTRNRDEQYCIIILIIRPPGIPVLAPTVTF